MTFEPVFKRLFLSIIKFDPKFYVEKSIQNGKHIFISLEILTLKKISNSDESFINEILIR